MIPRDSQMATPNSYKELMKLLDEEDVTGVGFAAREVEGGVKWVVVPIRIENEKGEIMTADTMEDLEPDEDVPLNEDQYYLWHAGVACLAVATAHDELDTDEEFEEDDDEQYPES